ncbi:MAG: bifunctional phosphoribosylaminoimidazolecarboxamide formyltransferase/IMP cyclohydrolase [Rhodospirillales bacterium]|nr:bifunctional phosphoribosylaminoimidazolecarboxamide formyltransferase/IMP cyclohydrolase [Rhodospirillales bacterium]
MSSKITRALISVSDKSGLVEFGQYLAGQDVHILSTGGSAKILTDAGVPVTEVSDYTGSPEMMDGRVKTLHPKVHGGLLAVRDNADHLASMEQYDIGAIDLLVVNLYPFEETVARGADFETCIENIDIGGPAMIRSAAKNHRDVTVVVDVEDYVRVRAEMDDNDGDTTAEFRRKMAATAYARTGAYDAAISQWFAVQTNDPFPHRIAVGGTLKQHLRYGENPHQHAAFYVTGDHRPGVATAAQLQGKELSFNNLNDTDAAFELVSEFTDQPACAIIKHANPCGVATGDTLLTAYEQAFRCDSTSAFGGIVALNRTLDGASAEQITKTFTEVIIAPDADEDARAILAKKQNLRLLLTDGMPDAGSVGMTVRTVSGGILLQGRDNALTSDDLRVVTERQPTDQEMTDLMFAFIVCKHVKSNAIVYVKDGATVGIGAGQMSRIDSSRIAAWKANESGETQGLDVSPAVGSVVASDAFFPFADGLLAAADAGATAIIQPGGSMRDDEIIAAANERGLAMVMTGMRHFRH